MKHLKTKDRLKNSFVCEREREIDRRESYDLKENGEKGKDGFRRDFRENSKEDLSDSISNENIFILFRFRD